MVWPFQADGGRRQPWLAALALLLPAAVVVVAAGARADQARLLPALDEYLATNVRLTPVEESVLIAGNPLAKLLESEQTKEIAVFGAVWISAPPASYVRQLIDIERFERGGAFRITKKISNPPRAEDFAALELPEDDLADLQGCKLGDCELKLGADALHRLRSEIDWRKPSAYADANALFRRLALDYVAGYRDGGNARLAVYRDKDRPTFVAAEFRSMIERLPPLAAYLPDLKRYLLEYPRETLADATDFMYWQEAQFGLKPTIRINHLVIQQRPDRTIVASKMLYASHYFWTALELRALLADARRGEGFWYVTVNRSRSDGLSGFTGRILRGRVRNEVQNGTLSALTATKRALEALPR
jgi:hypothetical protein